MGARLIQQQNLTKYINQLLQVELFQDYCPNGLQIEGRQTIKTIVTGVTACQDLIDQACYLKADALLVHHGYFWRGEPQPIVGIKQRRIKSLLANDINLYAYHLPLDAHPEYGNNAQLAKRLEIVIDDRMTIDNNPNIFYYGRFTKPKTAAEVTDLVTTQLHREPLYIGVGDQSINRIAWCTGAAQDFIDYAIELNCEAFITGEVSERTYHIAREQGLHFFACGHHATERYGIQSLGEHLALEFDLEHHFVDIDNPI